MNKPAAQVSPPGASCASATANDPVADRRQRLLELARERRQRREEKELLLAEARADRAHRMATPQRWTAGVRKQDTPSASLPQPSEYAQRLSKEAEAKEPARDAVGAATFSSLPPTDDAAQRRQRLTLRLPRGSPVQTLYRGDACVSRLVDWIALLLKLSPEEAVEKYAILDRSRVPPTEVVDETLTLDEAGLFGGATLVVQPRLEASPRSAAEMAKDMAHAIPKPITRRQAQEFTMALPGGLVGSLHGRYQMEDTAWRRAGMLVLLAERTAAGRALLKALPKHLHFLCLTVALPAGVAAERVSLIVRALQIQHPNLVIRGLVGHGATAQLCLRYAKEFGGGASAVQSLVLLSSAFDDLSEAPPVRAGSRILSVHGTADDEAPCLRAELWHTHHSAALDHTLRVLSGASHSLAGHVPHVADIINDWFEGARRLNDKDVPANLSSRAPDPSNVPAGGTSADDDDLAFYGF